MEASEQLEMQLSILEVLSNATEAIRPGDVGDIIGESALATGQYLTKLTKAGLAERTGKKKQPSYLITNEGLEYLNKPPSSEELEAKELGETTVLEPRRERTLGAEEETYPQM